MVFPGAVHLALAVLIVLGATAAPPRAGAAQISCRWQGADGANWSVAANWSCNRVPNNTAADQFSVTLDTNDAVLDIDAKVSSYRQENGRLLGAGMNRTLTVLGTTTWQVGWIANRLIVQGPGTFGDGFSDLTLANGSFLLWGSKQTKAVVSLRGMLYQGGIGRHTSTITRGSALAIAGNFNIGQRPGASGSLTNLGLLVKSSGGLPSRIDWTVLNDDGVIAVLAGGLVIDTLSNKKGIVRLGYQIQGLWTGTDLESPHDIVFTKSSRLEGVGTIRAPNVKNGGRIRGPATPDGLVLKVEADYSPPTAADLEARTIQGSDTLALFDSSVGGPGWTQDYNSRVQVSGNAELSGLLTIDVWPGYTPPTIATYPVLEVEGALTGAFDNVPHGGRLNTIDAAGSFLVQYGSGPYSQQVVLANYGPPLCGSGGPWGGGVTGCLPSGPSVGACEDAVANAAGKLLKKAIVCHRKHAKGKFPEPGFEEDCEAKARDAFDKKVAKLVGCPSCVAANADLLRDKLSDWLDADNGVIFCEGTVPLGDDDTGFVAPDPVVAKCEDKIAVAAAKLATGIIDCRRVRASGALTDETGCVAGARAEFDGKIATLEGCPACATANVATLADDIDTELARRNGLMFCGSPSGAFLD